MQNPSDSERSSSAEAGVTQQPSTIPPPARNPVEIQSLRLQKGFAWNPLRSLPRNQPCPCQSGEKFKNCCLKILPLAVSEAVAKGYREQMARPGLVFMTPENAKRLEAEALAQIAKGKEPVLNEGTPCVHKWKWAQSPGSADGPGERYCICDLCGEEHPGDD